MDLGVTTTRQVAALAAVMLALGRDHGLDSEEMPTSRTGCPAAQTSDASLTATFEQDGPQLGGGEPAHIRIFEIAIVDLVAALGDRELRVWGERRCDWPHRVAIVRG